MMADEMLAYATAIVIEQHDTTSQIALMLIALAAVTRGKSVAKVAADVIADNSLIVRY
jgi:AmiR/NasT family two-component response regulator